MNTNRLIHFPIPDNRLRTTKLDSLIFLLMTIGLNHRVCTHLFNINESDPLILFGVEFRDPLRWTGMGDRLAPEYAKELAIQMGRNYINV